MDTIRRAAFGALGGAGGAVALTTFRKALAALGVVEKTAPEQVVGRLEDLGLLDSWPPAARRALTVTAHFAYGAGIGAALGLLRRKSDDVPTETAVGGALGVLSWALNWTVVLPLIGAHVPPWKQRNLMVLLPIVDHAVFGAVWGLLNRRLHSKDD